MWIEACVWRTENDLGVNSPEVESEVVCYVTRSRGQGENALMGF